MFDTAYLAVAELADRVGGPFGRVVHGRADRRCEAQCHRRRSHRELHRKLRSDRLAVLRPDARRMVSASYQRVAGMLSLKQNDTTPRLCTGG